LPPLSRVHFPTGDAIHGDGDVLLIFACVLIANVELLHPARWRRIHQPYPSHWQAMIFPSFLWNSSRRNPKATSIRGPLAASIVGSKACRSPGTGNRSPLPLRVVSSVKSYRSCRTRLGHRSIQRVITNDGNLCPQTPDSAQIGNAARISLDATLPSRPLADLARAGHVTSPAGPSLFVITSGMAVICCSPLLRLFAKLLRILTLWRSDRSSRSKCSKHEVTTEPNPSLSRALNKAIVICDQYISTSPDRQAGVLSGHWSRSSRHYRAMFCHF
jgi:hypothetical protein